MGSKTPAKKNAAGPFLREEPSIPGTYQIHIVRVEKKGRQKCYTAYVPTSWNGLKELVKRHFQGVPGRKPEYFMKASDLRSF